MAKKAKTADAGKEQTPGGDKDDELVPKLKLAIRIQYAPHTSYPAITQIQGHYWFLQDTSGQGQYQDDEEEVPRSLRE